MQAHARLVLSLAAPAVLALGLTASGAAGDPARPDTIVQGGPQVDTGLSSSPRADLQRAMNRGSLEGLLKARGRLLALVVADPKSATAHYWVAVADWRIVPIASGGDDEKTRKNAERYCTEGLAQCDQALALDPRFAEAIALRASLQGLSIQFDPSRAMALGGEMMPAMDRAREIAPGNPRVLFLQALNTLHMPAFVGGGPARALPMFVKAQELYAAEAKAGGPGGDADAAWGCDDACLWAGRAAMDLKDYPAALGYFKKALEVNPDNGWVRSRLLPEAEKAAAEKS